MPIRNNSYTQLLQETTLLLYAGSPMNLIIDVIGILLLLLLMLLLLLLLDPNNGKASLTEKIIGSVGFWRARYLSGTASALAASSSRSPSHLAVRLHLLHLLQGVTCSDWLAVAAVEAPIHYAAIAIDCLWFV